MSMILTRTPFRVSLFGGGTDFEFWYQKHGAKIITFSIGYYCYIALRYLPPFFDSSHRIVWSKIEETSDIDRISHPVVKACLNFYNIKQGVELHHIGDLPARSGIGSSSSFTVGLIHALYVLQGRSVTKRQIINDAIFIEQNVLREYVGVQDQIQVGHGGFNLIEIKPNGDFSVSPISMALERLRSLTESLLLFYTGISRFSSEITKHTIESAGKNDQPLYEIASLTEEAHKILIDDSKPIDYLGELLHQSWIMKKSLSTEISTNEIDLMYEKAIEMGALGGKVLGAGGGGFLLLFAPPECHDKVRGALSDLVEIPFKMDQFGTTLVQHI